MTNPKLLLFFPAPQPSGSSGLLNGLTCTKNTNGGVKLAAVLLFVVANGADKNEAAGTVLASVASTTEAATL